VTAENAMYVPKEKTGSHLVKNNLFIEGKKVLLQVQLQFPLPMTDVVNLKRTPACHSVQQIRQNRWAKVNKKFEALFFILVKYCKKNLEK
jgi:hypothetical protein